MNSAQLQDLSDKADILAKSIDKAWQNSLSGEDHNKVAEHLNNFKKNLRELSSMTPELEDSAEVKESNHGLYVKLQLEVPAGYLQELFQEAITFGITHWCDSFTVECNTPREDGEDHYEYIARIISENLTPFRINFKVTPQFKSVVTTSDITCVEQVRDGIIRGVEEELIYPDFSTYTEGMRISDTLVQYMLFGDQVFEDL